VALNFLNGFDRAFDLVRRIYKRNDKQGVDMQTNEKTLARTEETEIFKFFVAKINDYCPRKTRVSGRMKEGKDWQH